jgi:hypothetical protein
MERFAGVFHMSSAMSQGMLKFPLLIWRLCFELSFVLASDHVHPMFGEILDDQVSGSTHGFHDAGIFSLSGDTAHVNDIRSRADVDYYDWKTEGGNARQKQ